MRDDRRSPRARAYHKLYNTPRWKQIRLKQLYKEPLCSRHKARGELVKANVVNHVKPHRGDLCLFYDENNLESLCAPCHDAEVQSEEKLGYSTRIGDDGWPVDNRHPHNRS